MKAIAVEAKGWIVRFLDKSPIMKIIEKITN
jgi:hypothetical protein